MDNAILAHRAERRRQAQETAKQIKRCPPYWQEATRTMIAAAQDDISARLLRDVFQVLKDSFGFDNARMGEFVSALNAYGKSQPRAAVGGEVKQDGGSQDNAGQKT